MKATIEFNLPDDQYEYELANKGGAMYHVLWELKAELRSMLKYGELPDQQYEIVKKIQDFLMNSLDDNEINMNK
jgi:hypothetical protein